LNISFRLHPPRLCFLPYPILYSAVSNSTTKEVNLFDWSCKQTKRSEP
jgi:hypothetical protein